MSETVSQKSLFSKGELWCQAHSIQYRKGSFPGEIIVTCLKCKRGKMYLYKEWVLCLACGFHAEQLAELEKFVEVRP